MENSIKTPRFKVVRNEAPLNTYDVSSWYKVRQQVLDFINYQPNTSLYDLKFHLESAKNASRYQFKQYHFVLKIHSATTGAVLGHVEYAPYN